MGTENQHEKYRNKVETKSHPKCEPWKQFSSFQQTSSMMSMVMSITLLRKCLMFSTNLKINIWQNEDGVSY